MFNDFDRIRSKEWHRVTNKKRAKLLRNRGEDIRWSVDLNCWIWNFNKRFRKFSKPPESFAELIFNNLED